MLQLQQPAPPGLRQQQVVSPVLQLQQPTPLGPRQKQPAPTGTRQQQPARPAQLSHLPDVPILRQQHIVRAAGQQQQHIPPAPFQPQPSPNVVRRLQVVSPVLQLQHSTPSVPHHQQPGPSAQLSHLTAVPVRPVDRQHQAALPGPLQHHPASISLQQPTSYIQPQQPTLPQQDLRLQREERSRRLFSLMARQQTVSSVGSSRPSNPQPSTSASYRATVGDRQPNFRMPAPSFVTPPGAGGVRRSILSSSSTNSPADGSPDSSSSILAVPLPPSPSSATSPDFFEDFDQ